MTASNDVPESKLDTIRKLLAQAEDESGATQAEREAFAQRAAELMARHGVTEALLDAGRDRRDDPMESRKFTITNPYSKPKRILLGAIATALSCKGIVLTGREVVHVFGRRSDLDRLDFLFTSLLTQAVGMVIQVRPPMPYPTASQTRSFRGNWILGFAVRISQRMDAGRAEAVASAAEAGLSSEGAEVVLANRAAQADSAMHAEHGRTQRDSQPRVTSKSGFNAGQRAGDRADMGQGRVSNRRRAIGA